MKQAAKGFTLIELMIVIAIIAILAAVAIPNFMSARDRAKISAAKQSIGTLRKAMEIYVADSEDSTYPTELNGSGKTESNLVASLGKYTTMTGILSATLDTTGAKDKIDLEVTISGYTIKARAKDRRQAGLTGTPSTIECSFKPSGTGPGSEKC